MALPNLTRALQIRRFEEWGLEGEAKGVILIGAMKRQQKITFGETRAFGVHDALVIAAIIVAASTSRSAPTAGPKTALRLHRLR